MATPRITIAGKLARETLAQFPDTPTRTLARKLRRQNPRVFKSIEHARTCLRNHRGAKGNKNRSEVKPVTKAVRTPEESEAARANPFGLPASDATSYLPYVIPPGLDRILVLSDIHLPYHDTQALEAAIRWAKRQTWDCLLINGDFLDSYQLSRYCRDPRLRRFKDELETGAEVINILRREIKPELVVYKLGNHEDRYETYMMNQAPELFDIPRFSWDVVFKLDDGLDLVGQKRIIHAGKLPIIHGHEYTRAVFSPVNPAKGVFNRAHSSVMIAHHHQTSEHSDPDIKGRVMTAFSTGCLSELHPAYMPLNRWNHGFAAVELQGDTFHVQNLKIVDGTVF